MRRAGVPTGDAHDLPPLDPAVAYLESIDGPYVVKADGLAAGKGVLVTEDRIAAEAWVRVCLDGRFGEAGLDGGHRGAPRRTGGLGASPSVTGSVPWSSNRPATTSASSTATPDPTPAAWGATRRSTDLPGGLVDFVLREVMEPALATLRRTACPYRGFLYAGLMLTADGPQGARVQLPPR